MHSGEHRSPRSAAWAERLWRRPAVYGAVALAVLVGLALPVTELKTSTPSIKVVPAADSSRVGYNQVQAAFGEGATGPLEIVTRPRDADTVTRLARHDAGIAAVLPVQSTGAAHSSRRSRGTIPPIPPSARRSTACERSAADSGIDRRRGCREP